MPPRTAELLVDIPKISQDAESQLSIPAFFTWTGVLN